MPRYGFDVKKKSLIEDKRKFKVQRVHTCWNPKRHISLVSLNCCDENGGYALLHLDSMLANVVSEAVSEMKY